MPTEVKRRADGTVSSVHVKAEKGADDSGALGVSERMRATNLGEMDKTGKGFPKRADYDSQEAYIKAIKAHSDASKADPIKSGQKAALRKQ
jgi:hypothetical protein